MTNKPTDAEILKALECCTSYDCEHCRYESPILEDSLMCYEALMKNSLDLINRLKAENEELNTIIFTDRSEAIKLLKAEAIKEFAERLKEYTKLYSYITPRDIDNLVRNGR